MKIPPLRNFSEDKIIYDFMREKLNKSVKESPYLQDQWFEFILCIIEKDVNDLFIDVICRRVLVIGRFVIENHQSFVEVNDKQ